MEEKQVTRVDDPETGMYVIGYIGQTKEQLTADLKHRKEMLSDIPVHKTR